MKQTTLVTALLFLAASPASLLAQEPAASDAAPETAASGTARTAAGNSGAPCPRHGMGMMRQGKARHGGMSPGGSHDMERQAGDQQVVRRLEMIEARMAKIEAMLETLIRR